MPRTLPLSSCARMGFEKRVRAIDRCALILTVSTGGDKDVCLSSGSTSPEDIWAENHAVRAIPAQTRVDPFLQYHWTGDLTIARRLEQCASDNDQDRLRGQERQRG